MARAKKKKKQKPAKAQKKPKPKHLCELGECAGILSRNDSYREDARGHLRGAVPNYNNPATILAGIKARDASQGRPDGKYKNGQLIEGKTQEQRAQTYLYDYNNVPHGCNNFEDGMIPYPNQAHHILVCEVFYDKKWDAEHLNVLLQCPYDINNAENIIYLPQGDKGREYYCKYHMLPNHAKNHPAYNERVTTECKPIYDKVDEAVQKGDCPEAPDLRDAILKMLKQIEKANFGHLIALGPGPMS